MTWNLEADFSPVHSITDSDHSLDSVSGPNFSAHSLNIATDDITIDESLFEPLHEGAGITVCGTNYYGIQKELQASFYNSG